MAHTSRLSGFSDARTATPAQTDADRPQQDEAAAFERAAAHIQPSWAHLVPSEGASERLVDTRPERPGREAPGAPHRSASTRRRRQREDSLADFPRAVRDRRSAALWFALVTLAALGLAWAWSDESLPKPETRATVVPADRFASPEPASGQPSVEAATNMRAGVQSQAHATAAPRLATPATAVTPSEHAAQPVAPAAARDLSDPALALPVARRSDPPSATARTPAQAGAVPTKPVALTRPALTRTAKPRRPVGASASTATEGAPPHQARALNAQTVADEATAELTMQVEQAAEPLLQMAPRPPVGNDAIGDNPYDEGL